MGWWGWRGGGSYRNSPVVIETERGWKVTLFTGVSQALALSLTPTHFCPMSHSRRGHRPAGPRLLSLLKESSCIRTLKRQIHLGGRLPQSWKIITFPSPSYPNLPLFGPSVTDNQPQAGGEVYWHRTLPPGFTSLSARLGGDIHLIAPRLQVCRISHHPCIAQWMELIAFGSDGVLPWHKKARRVLVGNAKHPGPGRAGRQRPL